ncbi:MAG: thioredoxin family protein [Dehalococcoidia bacterium]
MKNKWIKLVSLILLSSLALCTVNLSCGDEDGEVESDIIPGCSPRPVVVAPDINLCTDFGQAQLEKAVFTAGGGCACGEECQSQTITDKGDGTYLLKCINQCGTVTATGEVGYLQWLSDWDEAMEQAKANDKPIAINFFTDLCPACRSLDENTFANKEVAGFMCENFINVKSNSARTGLHANYGIWSVPTTVFTTPDGTEMGRITGYFPPERFILGLEQALNAWNEEQT